MLPFLNFSIYQSTKPRNTHSNEQGFPLSHANLNASMQKEVLTTFEEIHDVNVVHRIRPANILVAEEGNKVWIIDFEDGQIIADGDEERESKVSEEMEAVREMLQHSKTGPSLSGYSEIQTSQVPPLEVR